MLKLQINGRFDTKSSLYFDICRVSHQDFEKHNAEFFRKIEEPHTLEFLDLGNLLHLGEIRRRCWVEAVIFGALCLEAFIYDYAATHLSDTYTKHYLDKIELKSKWVIIPKLATGQDFPTGNQAFEHLRRLVYERNQLVHAKSKPMPNNDEELKSLAKAYNKTDLEALNPYQTVVEVLTELSKLEGEVERKWWELVKTGGSH